MIVATCSRGTVRPRRVVRDHPGLVRWGGACVAFAFAVTTTAAAALVSYERAWLVATCAAVALLVGFVAWLLLVEKSDDGDPSQPPTEPEWWPAFERELDEWTRTRVPSGSRL